MVSQFTPITDMELEIQNLIKESGMGEDDVAENEELKLVQISKDELMERQQELSKMRALCFFKEQKQKKIAKIKSKVYRKLHRKKKTDDLDLEELKKIDPQLAEERVQKLELERAKERVSLKHKNTSKWAKQMLNRKDNDPDTRIALMKQLEKHQQLKKRITGMDSDESDQNADLQNDDNLLGQLDDLENDIDEVEPPLKGLMGMKFMQKGLERQKNETKELIRTARNLEDFEEDELSDLDDVLSVEGHCGVNQKEVSDISDGYLSTESDDFKDEYQHSIQTSGPITVGHVKQLKPLFEVKPFEIKDQNQAAYFGNVNNSNVAELSDQESRETEKSTLESEHSVDIPELTEEKSDSEEEESAVANPWLHADFSGPLQKSHKEDHVDGMTRSALKLEKHKRKLEKAKDESMIQLELEKEVYHPKENSSDVISDDENSNPTQQKSMDLEDNQLSGDESNSDHDLNVIHSADISKLSRADIMRLTFENDNVIEVKKDLN
jgi:U3 small nucleolar RNA-associated protein 14